MLKLTLSRHIAAAACAVFIISLTACGGGGGGTPSIPSPGGGGSPPPTSSPGATATPVGTSTPKATATPVQTATPMQTPTPIPTATPAGRGITMLPDTTGRFGLFQVFDWDGNPNHAPLSNAQIDSEAPHEDAVWGAFNPGTWDAAHSGMIVSRYMLPVDDDNTVSGHNLSWWQSNHPDWILYACDSGGNPTKMLAWSTSGFPEVPLDFTNPSVINYQMGLMIPYLKANGYNALAVDNTDLLNYLKGGNPEFGQPIVSGDYGCGTYDTSGNFHRLFGPGNDPAFITAMINWTHAVSQQLHNNGLKLIINHPLYNAPTDPNEQQMLANADGMLFEQGFTDYGKYQTAGSGIVNFAIEWGEYAQQHHVAFLITDYLCSSRGGTQPFNGNAPCPTDPNAIPAPQIDWSLATYALINEGGEDVYVSPQTGEWYSYRPDFTATYGAPCGAYAQIAPNVYQRRFNGGMVVVNANSSSYSVSLPANHAYHDLEGRAVTNPLHLTGTDGYVLLTTNGCT